MQHRDYLIFTLSTKTLARLTAVELRELARAARWRAREIGGWAAFAENRNATRRAIKKRLAAQPLGARAGKALQRRRRNVQILRLARRGKTNVEIARWLAANGYGALTAGTISAVVGAEMRRVASERKAAVHDAA
jgi:hypothetical protein